MSSLGCGELVAEYLVESARKVVLRGFRSEPCVLRCVAPGVQLILEASPPSQTAVVVWSVCANWTVDQGAVDVFKHTKSYCLLIEAIPRYSKSPFQSVADIIFLLTYLVLSFPMYILDVSMF